NKKRPLGQAAPHLPDPPGGCFLSWERPGNKKASHAAPSACCPPREGAFCLGSGPATKKPPTLRLRLAALPGRALFVLGAARQQKSLPRCAFGLLPSQGGRFLSWERPGNKKGVRKGRLQSCLTRT